MSTVRSDDPVVAIACSDIHLSLKPPIARAREPDWFEAMERPWREIKRLAEKHKCGIVCAGDIFDKWNSSAELINWALTVLPDSMYAIPGNHDLPSHRERGEHRSAYGTLVRAGKIMNLEGGVMGLGRRRLGNEPSLDLLLIHRYLAIPDHAYHDAPREVFLPAHTCPKEFRGADVVIVGDNHKGFAKFYETGTMVFNCGSLMRRKSDEWDYQPQVGLIHESGNVTSHKLDTSKDVLTRLVPEGVEERDARVIKFVEHLDSLTTNLESPDYRSALIRAMELAGVSHPVRELLSEALDARS